MATDPSAGELVELLSRRANLLETLEEESRAKRDLVADVDASRSTVDRAVRELEAIGAVDATGECSLTLSGRLLLDAYRRFGRTGGAVLETRDLLDHLQADAPLDPVLLHDAEVVAADSETRYRPGRRMADLLADADRLVGLARAHTQPDAADNYRRKLLEDGMDAELVFAREMYERLADADDVRARLLAAENLTAHTVESVPYGLFLLDVADRRLVCLLVYDAENVLRGLVISDDDRALDWGERVFERFRERAEPV